jgi:hypothetical protein
MSLFRLLQRLHRDDGAQISFLAVAGVVCFIGLMSMVVNTDDLVSERVRVQNVADATVLSAASWTARGLNMESYINVLNTKLLSTAVLLNALNDALPVIEGVGRIQEAIFTGCSGVPFIGAFCAVMAAVVKVQLAVLTPLKNAVKNLAQRLSSCSSGGQLWNIMTTLQRAGDAVRASFPGIGIAESVSIAAANGTTGVVLSGKLSLQGQLTLPVKLEPFAQFCEPLKNGGPGYELQGYEVGQGPLELGRERIKRTLLLPFINFFSWPIFNGMVSSHIVQVGCTTDPGEDTDVPVKLSTLDECRKYEATSRWSHLWSKTRPIANGSYRVGDFVPWKPLNESNAGSDNEALYQQEIQEQLGNINIPQDQQQAGGPVGADIQPGPAYQHLDPTTESRPSGSLAPGDCAGSGFPTYTPPFGQAWEINAPGNTFCFIVIGGSCSRIDEWNRFTWYNTYNGQHTRNGRPERVGGYFIRMTREELDPEEEGGPTLYEYAIETVSLVDAGTEKMSQEEFKEYLEENGQNVDSPDANASQGCTKPQPWMLTKDEEDFRDRLKFIGMVHENVADKPLFWSTYFTQPPPRLMAYAQAEVYNYLSEDTFTQDWRVRLQPASLLTDFLGKVAGIVGLGGVVNEAIDTVNNH